MHRRWLVLALCAVALLAVPPAGALTYTDCEWNGSLGTCDVYTFAPDLLGVCVEGRGQGESWSLCA